jgi:hypothetical protein
MKKIIAIALSFLFISLQSVKAEMGIGVTAAAHMFDASGTETTRTSGEVNTGSHSETVVIPELFIEAISDSGAVIGLSYIPTRDLGAKSRSDTNSDGDTGTYTAKAEFDNVMQLYTDIPVSEVSGYPIHVKLGIQHATLKSLESLNSGSEYPDEDLFGYTLGLGTKGDLPYGNNMYYKAEATYTDFQDFSQTSDSTPGNVVSAELEDVAVKFSIGYKF